MSSSSSIPLSFNPLHSWQQKSSKKLPSSFDLNTSTSTRRAPKSHILCTTFNTSESREREEIRWLREEQRWLREEKRWIKEEQRWEDERETLLNEIEALKARIENESDNDDDDNASGNILLRVVNTEARQIAERGSSASPFVIEDAEEVVVEAIEEEAVKEVVVRVLEEVKLKMKRKMLRVGSEGDDVQLLQEELQKLGFYCGEEDEEFASFSSGTEIAVKTWQSSIGVPETGVMTVELLERLFVDKQDRTSGFNEGGNGVAANSIAQTPEIPLRNVKEAPHHEVFENRVFLLGENRWEDSSRLTNRNSQSQTNSKGVVKTMCIACRGEGRILCIECDGTGEPNIEPQFLEWVGEETKCPYCEADGYTICDSCQGTGVGVSGA